MVRSILTAAGVLAILSTAAFAEGSTTKIIRSTPTGMSKTIVHKHVNHYGALVTKKRTMTDGVGSSVTRSRTTVEPGAGGTTTVTKSTNSN